MESRLITSSSFSSNPPQIKHHVFLSFRGQDTCNNFISHLKKALRDKQIKTYNDQLNIGDEISPSLLKAIEESKISVIAFSEGYASSSWCLDELVKILECRVMKKQMVIPVFYGVDPSVVRHQTGCYADAFAKHEQRFKQSLDKVQRWKDSLKEASCISGFVSLFNKPESVLIDNIVDDVLKKLNNMSPSYYKDLVGIHSGIEQIEYRLKRDVRSVGIGGIGGIGKTTLAQARLSRKISCQYDSSCQLDKETKRFKMSITYWEKGELLGRGSFGSVYEGISDDGLFFAVKEVSLLDQGSQGMQSIYQLEQEIALLSQFEHENIVRYFGTDKDESKLYIFLELVTKGSLLKLYQSYHLRDSQVSAYTRQILHGLKYLHDRNVVHRDIKCANILVDASGCVKLADFGLAKATKNDIKSCKGTAFWMAPEVVNNKNQGYGIQADIWSLGCTVLEMLTRQIPYSHLECMQALFQIGRGVPPPISDLLSKDAREFILKCLQTNPSDRPTAAQLLDHSFVNRPLPTFSGSPSPRLGKRKLKANGVVTSKLKRQERI